MLDPYMWWLLILGEPGRECFWYQTMLHRFPALGTEDRTERVTRKLTSNVTVGGWEFDQIRGQRHPHTHGSSDPDEGLLPDLGVEF